MSLAHPTTMLHNTSTGRFHPMPFRRAPAPSEGETDRAGRYKSIGHHTDGFATMDEAVAWVRARPEFRWTGLVESWDGKHMPVSVMHFEHEAEAAS